MALRFSIAKPTARSDVHRVRAIGAVLFSLVLAACAAGPKQGRVEHRVAAPFDAMSTARQNEEGAAVASCAGGPVAMFPVTPYASERVARIYGGTPEPGFVVTRSAKKAALEQLAFDPDPPEYRSFMRATNCDARGQFQFRRVKDGDYYVFTLVTWQQQPFDGQLMLSRVAVRGGASAAVTLTTSRERGS